MATRHQISITRDHRRKNGWVRFAIRGGLRGQAMVWDEPSAEFGMAGGRISKLYIERPLRRSDMRMTMPVFEYDRGPCLDAAPDEQEVVDDVVRQLEALPPTTEVVR